MRDQIEDVRLAHSGLLAGLNCIGWGFGGKGFDGTNGYIVPGSRRALAIRYRDGDRIRRVLVSTDESELLLAAMTATAGSEALLELRVGEVEVEAPQDEDLGHADRTGDDDRAVGGIGV